MHCCDVEEMDCYDCQIEPPKEIEIDVVPVEGQQGPKGDKGDKGDKGETGPKGDTGPMPTIAQTTGTSTTKVMSQNATTAALGGKQDKLIAGTNIQITQDGKTITATDTTYIAGNGLNLDDTEFSADTITDILSVDSLSQDDKLTTGKDLKTAVGTVSQSGSNPLDIFELYPYGFSDADGNPNPSASAFWCTGLIPLNIGFNANQNRWLVGNCLYIKDYSKVVYKIGYFDENKNIIRVARDLPGGHNIGMSATTYPDVSNYKYARIQFEKSAIPMDEAKYVFFTPSVEYYDRANYTPSNAIKTFDLASGAVLGSNLSEMANVAQKYSALKAGIMPFDERDFSNTQVPSATGIPQAVAQRRLSTTRIFLIPKDTAISVPYNSNWSLTALLYNGFTDNTFIPNSSTEWTKNLFFNEDTHLRLTFRYVVDGADADDLYTDEKLNDLLASLQISNVQRDYGYTGEKINLGNTFNAVNTKIKTLGQDGAIYNGKIIEINALGYYNVQGINGRVYKNRTALAQQATIAPHGNSVCFGTEKYDNSDNFPIFYNNAYNNTALPKGACYVYRLKNDYTTALLQTIQIGFTNDAIWSDGNDIRPYGNFVVDTDNDKLYVFTMKDDIQKTRFFRFALPTLSQGSTVTLDQADIEDYFDVDYMFLIQGCCYHNGKIFALSGNDASRLNSSKMSVVNLTTKTIDSVVPLSEFFGEPETVFVHNNKLFVGMDELYEMEF